MLPQINSEKDKMENKFVFLYPQKEIFDYELEFASYTVDDEWWDTRKDYFQPKLDAVKSDEDKKLVQKEARNDRTSFFTSTFMKLLNRAIDERYRQNNFQIFYALLEGELLADIIEKKDGDRIIYVGMDAKTHRTKREDGSYPYPDQNYILNQLLPLNRLVIGGFHMWDCVEKLAKTAYDRGIEVLVDEDLTNIGTTRFLSEGFRTDKYPTYNPREHGDDHLRMFIDARKDTPWLWQDY